MEFLRFGSSIPGEYWGCCAGDIIQNFKQDPDTKASIQLVEGDSGFPLTHGSEGAYLGPTLRDIFWQRLRVSTFGKTDMPNHFFIAVLEDGQLSSGHGKKWLALLKEAGFEFLRTVDNSVYTGPNLLSVEGSEPTPCDCGDPDCEMMDEDEKSPHKNHLFLLVRNIGGGKIDDPFTPPKAWTDLPNKMSEPWQFLEPALRKDIASNQRLAHTNIWNEHGPTVIMKESEVVAAGAPVIMAGVRTALPVQTKAARDAAKKVLKKEGKIPSPSAGTQFLY